MFQRILVPLDGSPGAERAIPAAARIARSIGGSLVFFHVIVPSLAWVGAAILSQKATQTVEEEEQAVTNAASYLTATIATYHEDLEGVSTEIEIAFGLASPTLSSAAHVEQVDLIVMCSHREAGLGQWGLESIAQQTMRHSPVPLLILNEHGTFPALDASHPVRALIPLDGSLFAEAAIEPAIQLVVQFAGPLQKELSLVRVLENLHPGGERGNRHRDNGTTQEQAWQEAERYMRAMSDRLSARSHAGNELHITSSVEIGTDVVGTILQQVNVAADDAETGHADLIAMATHGREGMQRLIVGSVAERILDAAICPVLIVCPQRREVK